MKCFTGILTLVAFVAGILAQDASTVPNELKDFTIVPAQWETQVIPDGPLVTLNGTVEEVHAQLIDLNPNWDVDFPDANTVSSDGLLANETADGRFDAGANFDALAYSCISPMYRNCDPKRIKQGISYLNRIGGRPELLYGSCSRVSCSYHASIHWCNQDNTDHRKTLKNYGEIADGAQYVLDKCTENKKVKGIVYNKENWVVYVTHAKC